jgi:hypothetical protein
MFELLLRWILRLQNRWGTDLQISLLEYDGRNWKLSRFHKVVKEMPLHFTNFILWCWFTEPLTSMFVFGKVRDCVLSCHAPMSISYMCLSVYASILIINGTEMLFLIAYQYNRFSFVCSQSDAMYCTRLHTRLLASEVNALLQVLNCRSLINVPRVQIGFFPFLFGRGESEVTLRIMYSSVKRICCVFLSGN